MRALDSPGPLWPPWGWQDVQAGGQDSVPATSLNLPPGDHDVFDDGILRIRVTSKPPGLALAGDVDEFTFPNLVDALEMICGEFVTVHVDFAEVTYCDLAGLRAIVKLTEANGHTGDYCAARRVALRGLPRQLKVALHVLGWDSTPGLVLY